MVSRTGILGAPSRVHTRRRASTLAAFAYLLALVVAADHRPLLAQDREAEATPRYLPLAIGGTGLFLGDAPRANGLRINLRDRYLEEVNGINLTLWGPHRDGVNGMVRGISLGPAPAAHELTGVNLGLAAVVTSGPLSGIQLGGFAVVSEGIIRGVSVGGLALVSEGGTNGISLSGLATVSEGRIRGISGAGLALVSEEGMVGASGAGLALVSEGSVVGVSAAGLALVSERSVAGASAAGLALVSGEDIRGLSAAGLALVAERDIQGISAAGLATVAGRSITGITLAGYKVDAPRVRGLTAAGGWIEAEEIRGLSVAGYQRSGLQVGLSVALVNWVDELRGVQVGLLNRAGNNPAPFRVLPFVNAHF